MSGAQDSRIAAQREVKVVKHERVELGDSASRHGVQAQPRAAAKRRSAPAI